MRLRLQALLVKTRDSHFLEKIAELKQFEEKSEVLAKELISVKDERDILQDTLASSNVTLGSLQNLLDENEDSIKNMQFKVNEELDSLKSEERAATFESAETNAQLLQRILKCYLEY